MVNQIFVETPQRVRKGEADRFRDHPVSRHMLEQVDKLGGSYRVERSFRLLPGRLLCNRFIVTIPLNHHLKGAAQAALEVFKTLSMPEEHYTFCEKKLSRAAKIHLGFEEDGNNSLLKAYLEFPYDHAAGVSKPWQLLLGFKWAPHNPGHCVVSSYMGLPVYTPGEVHAMTESFFADKRLSGVRGIVTAILMACDRRMGNLRMWYLDVTEEGNPRRSFDVKTYRARLNMIDLMPFFPDLFWFYQIPYSEYESYFDTIKNHKFGHLSCGIGRNGDFFMAIYHEAPGQ